MALFENTSVSGGLPNHTHEESNYKAADPFGIGIFKDYMLKILPFNETWIKSTSYANGTRVENTRYANGTTVENTPHVNGTTVENTRYANGTTVENTRYANGTTVENTPHVNGTTVENTPYANGTTVENTPHVNDTTVKNTPYANGTKVENTHVNGNTVENIPYTNGNIVENTPHVNGTNVENTPYANGTTVENTPHVNDTTVENTPYAYGNTVENTPHVNGTTVENTPYANGTTVENTPYINSITVENTPYVNGPTVENPKVFCNGTNGYHKNYINEYHNGNVLSSNCMVDNEKYARVNNFQNTKSRLSSKNIYDTACPLEIAVSGTAGRYLRARRNISAGEVLFIEPPIAMATRPKSPPHCMNCYKLTSSFKCLECGFFLCGPECLTDFHKMECQFLKHLGAADNSDDKKMEQPLVQRLQEMPREMRAQAMAMIERAKEASKEQKHQEIMQQYVILATLRTMLVIQASEFYKNVIMAMQANLEHGNERYNMNQKLIVDVIVNRLRASNDSELIHRICSVWDTNAFQVVLPQNSRVQGLFPLAALINHDCRPNAQQWFNEKGELVLRAIDYIPKGAIVSISYTDPQWSTIVRQNHLQKCKQFSCTCKRCLDPTELGTFIGSLICVRCGSPMISSDPLDTTANWVCTISTCRHTMEAKQILSLGANLGALTQKVNPCNVAAVTSLAKLLERQVHPNHYSLLQMYLSVINVLTDKDLAEVSDEELCCLSRISSRLMEVTRVLQSPLARITASVAREDLRLRLEAIKRAEMKSGRDGTRQRLADMSTQLHECVQVLGWDPSMPTAVPLLQEYQAILKNP
ncbi:uncharacterized protein [Palaemon carinicauda]|uniref:uncharacterized protein isoform X2 n=1 Tax=Palaemon carinicauda TaxID=392227 RepID=UPI0035B5AEA8